MNRHSHLQKTIEDILQNNYSIISFFDLQADETYKNKCIVGKIEFLSAIKVRQKNGHIRKCLLSDATSEDSASNENKLSVFLFDDLAVGSSCAEAEGFLMIADFQVENLTLSSQRIKGMGLLPIQVLVKDTSEFWVFQKKSTTADDEFINENAQLMQGEVLSSVQQPLAIPTSSTKPYSYVPLCELANTSDQKNNFNIYGIVEDCQLKTNPKPQASVLSFLLSDSTKKDFSVTVFVLADETFPDVHPGDIVRIHRMNVENYRGTLKGKCMMARFILVFSKKDNGAIPISVAKTYTFTDDDRIEVNRLFAWAEKRYCKCIADIQIGDSVNLICQVISIYLPRTSDSVLLTIWDGTKNTNIEVEHREELEQKTNVDNELWKIAKDYAIKLWVNGNFTLVAGELQPKQFIEVRDAEMSCSKNAPSARHASLVLKPSYTRKRDIKIIRDGDRLAELKSRLEKITSEMVIENSSDSETIENIISFVNSVTGRKDAVFFEPTTVGSNQDSLTMQTDSITAQSETALNTGAVPDDVSTQLTVSFPNQLRPSEEHNPPLGFLPKQQAILSATVQSGQSTQTFGNYTEVQLPLVSPELRLSQFPTSCDGAQSQQISQELYSKDAITRVKSHVNVEYSSISDIISHSVPYKFRVLGNVLSFHPDANSISKLIRLYCRKCHYLSEDAEPKLDVIGLENGVEIYHCPYCASHFGIATALHYTYLICFSLQDGTQAGMIDVYIWLNNAVNFFKGIRPEDALLNNTASEMIFEILWSICPNAHPGETEINSLTVNSRWTSYPVLDCCIMSYTANGVTRYQMFDTVIS